MRKTMFMSLNESSFSLYNLFLFLINVKNRKLFTLTKMLKYSFPVGTAIRNISYNVLLTLELIFFFSYRI